MLCKCSVWMIIPAVHLYAPVEDAFKNVILTLYIYDNSMRFTYMRLSMTPLKTLF